MRPRETDIETLRFNMSKSSYQLAYATKRFSLITARYFNAEELAFVTHRDIPTPSIALNACSYQFVDMVESAEVCRKFYAGD